MFDAALILLLDIVPSPTFPRPRPRPGMEWLVLLAFVPMFIAVLVYGVKRMPRGEER